MAAKSVKYPSLVGVSDTCIHSRLHKLLVPFSWRADREWCLIVHCRRRHTSSSSSSSSTTSSSSWMPTCKVAVPVAIASPTATRRRPAKSPTSSRTMAVSVVARRGGSGSNPSSPHRPPTTGGGTPRRRVVVSATNDAPAKKTTTTPGRQRGGVVVVVVVDAISDSSAENTCREFDRDDGSPLSPSLLRGKGGQQRGGGGCEKRGHNYDNLASLSPWLCCLVDLHELEHDASSLLPVLAYVGVDNVCFLWLVSLGNLC